MSTEVICPYCGHVWNRKTDTKSRSCPKCHRTIVQRTPRPFLRCNRCGNTWEPRSLDKLPGTCPACKSPYWNKERVRWHPPNPKNRKGTWKQRMCAIHAHTPFYRKSIGGIPPTWSHALRPGHQRSFPLRKNARNILSFHKPYVGLYDHSFLSINYMLVYQLGETHNRD